MFENHSVDPSKHKFEKGTNTRDRSEPATYRVFAFAKSSLFSRQDIQSHFSTVLGSGGDDISEWHRKKKRTHDLFSSVCDSRINPYQATFHKQEKFYATTVRL